MIIFQDLTVYFCRRETTTQFNVETRQPIKLPAQLKAANRRQVTQGTDGPIGTQKSKRIAWLLISMAKVYVTGPRKRQDKGPESGWDAKSDNIL